MLYQLSYPPDQSFPRNPEGRRPEWASRRESRLAQSDPAQSGPGDDAVAGKRAFAVQGHARAGLPARNAAGCCSIPKGI